MPGVKGMDTLNQRWANDKSKFGYKMLVKMGWSDGKGAGKNEDGRASHVKVDKRPETLGLGTSEDGVGNAAFQGQISNFNDVLRSLNQAHGADAKQRKEERRKMRKKLKNAKAGDSEQVSTEATVVVRTEKLADGSEVRDIGVVSIETEESGAVEIAKKKEKKAAKEGKKNKKSSKKSKKASKKRARDEDSDSEDDDKDTDKAADAEDDEGESKPRKKLAKADAAVARKVAIRLVRAKDVSSYSRGDLNAIFGIAS